MATLARYQAFALDDAGNVLASPTVEVRDEGTAALAALFSDRAGTTGIGNPFTGGSDGLIAFHVAGGAYKITVTSGSVTRIFRYVGIATFGEHDFVLSCPATTGNAILKADGAGGTTAGTAGTDFMRGDTTSLVSKGFTLTPSNAGTKSSGTFTPDPTLGNYQYYTNGGAHTLAAPASDCAIDLLVTNNASAGAITFSGFTVSATAGSALTTTNTSKFIISIRRINAISTYSVYAMQ
jgi:hypothetical protein